MAIAQKFGIKEQTVRNQLRVLFQKLSVRTRLELAVKLGPHAKGCVKGPSLTKSS
jgi:DNA-binding NarL/FixJ family response regulator